MSRLKLNNGQYTGKSAGYGGGRCCRNGSVRGWRFEPQTPVGVHQIHPKWTGLFQKLLKHAGAAYPPGLQILLAQPNDFHAVVCRQISVRICFDLRNSAPRLSFRPLRRVFDCTPVCRRQTLPDLLVDRRNELPARVLRARDGIREPPELAGGYDRSGADVSGQTCNLTSHIPAPPLRAACPAPAEPCRRRNFCAFRWSLRTQDGSAKKSSGTPRNWPRCPSHKAMVTQ